MIATVTTFLAILALSIIGFAMLAAIKPRFSIGDVLCAPVIGLCVLIVPAIWLTRAGLSGETFASPLLAVMLLASAVGIAALRPSLSVLRVAAIPVSAVVALVLFVIGLPQLHYGFNWLSFSNDDMTNYVLDATRLLHSSEFTEPKIADLLNSTHPEGWTWFVFTKEGDRYGFDIFLAMFAAVARRSTLAAYMPTILTMHVCITLAATAIFAKNRSAAAVTFIAAAIALAPANVAATYYQLGPQIAGIACLAAAFYFLTGPRAENRLEFGGTIALGAIAFSGLLATYPELAGVFGLALVISSARLFWPLGAANVRATMMLLAIRSLAGAGAVAFLGIAGLNAVSLLFAKTREGAMLASSHLFSGFSASVTPSGVASMFGFSPVDTIVHGIAGSLDIAAALVLAAVTVYWALRSLAAGDSSSTVTAVFFALLTALVIGRNGYGAFKVILYVQPFLFGTLADAALGLQLVIPANLRRVPLVLFGAAFLAMLPTIAFYIGRSDDPLPMRLASYTLIPTASAANLSGDLERIASESKNRTVVSDSSIEPLSKIENVTVAGSAMAFPSHDAFATLRYFHGFNRRFLPAGQYEKFADDARKMTDEYDFSKSTIGALAAAGVPAKSTPIKVYVATRPQITKDALFLYQGRNFTIFNRNGSLPETRSVALVPYAKATNALVFVDSSLGASRNFFGYNPSLFGLEPDYFFRGETMAAVGRYLVFEIVNPVHPRLELWFTRSLANSGNPALPAEIKIYGKREQSVPLGGAGSARVVSAPFEPVTYLGHSYFAIDLQTSPKIVANPPETMLAGLFNGDLIKEDTRPVVGFVRDISILGDASSHPLPTGLTKFPGDLEHCCVEYSGLYEDGWLSKDSWFGLRSEADSDELIIDGSVPANIGPDAIAVVLDGRQLYRQALVPGVFTLTVPLPKRLKTGPHRIELHLSSTRRLGPADPRPAGALLYSIGFHAN